MSSKWTHSVCARCYKRLEPTRKPIKMKNAELEACCYCSARTVDGIYYRDDPANARLCEGHE